MQKRRHIDVKQGHTPGLCDSKDLEWMDSLSANSGCLTGKLLMSLLHVFISSLLGLSQVIASEMTLG